MILYNLYRRNKYILACLRLILRWTHFFIFWEESRDGHGTGLPVPRIFVPGTWVPKLIIPGLTQRFLSCGTRVPTCPKLAWDLDVLEISVPGLSQQYLSQSQAPQVKQSQSHSEVPGFVSRAKNPMESQSHCPSLEERFQIRISRKFCVVLRFFMIKNISREYKRSSLVSVLQILWVE